VAEKVHAEDELQGNVESLDAAGNPQSLVVLNQTVYVDGQTEYAGGLAGYGSIVIGDLVEIHGQRDAVGGIMASRIEKLTSGEVELKGIVSGLAGTTFFIGLQEVDFATAVMNPTGSSPADGDRVKVEGSLAAGILVATELELMDLTEDPDLELQDGMEAELEGYITDLAEPNPGLFAFKVNGEVVSTTAATEYSGGSSANMGNDVKVEVHGTSDGSSLIATEVQFSEIQVELEGTASAHSATSITIFDLTITLNDLTELPVEELVDGQRYKVEANIEGATLIADSVESVGMDNDFLQAPVEAETGNPTWTMTLLGIVADLSGETIVFKDSDGITLTRDEFFTAVIPGTGTAGTLINIQGGDYTGGTIPDISEVKLED